jgi:hypothetical protein
MMTEIELFVAEELLYALFEALTQIEKEPVEGYFYPWSIIPVKICPYRPIFRFPWITDYSFSYQVIADFPDQIEQCSLGILAFLDNIGPETLIPERTSPVEFLIILFGDA